MTKIRWGLLTAGYISTAMAQALTDTPEAEMVAVAARAPGRARDFAARWGISQAYGSYYDLVNDPDVEVVYIGSPHSHHYEHLKLCLEAGKHVLCEKAFTLNAAQAEECVALARAKGLFVMEAMWMRFIPAMRRVQQWVTDGTLGAVRWIQADFCIYRPLDVAHRLYNPALGGGALLDLGIYPLSMTTYLLGLPDGVQGVAQLAPTGVDELDAITLDYRRGALAQLACSMRIEKPREAVILGSAGMVKLHSLFYRPDHVTLQRYGHEAEHLHIPFESNGYKHEVDEVHACLKAGRTESAIMPLDETLALMRIMDGLRAAWGVRYAVAGE